ncbi:MAG: hypothetical protein Q8P62_01565 [Candidatus Peregrinibacteria bacterium]|nr:hypothetical protein [Candidatus Peregrinibacteria bacterium]
MHIKKRPLVIFLSIVAISFIAGLLYMNKGVDPNYSISINGKNIVVSQDKWKFVEPFEPSLYSKNYSAINKRDGHEFEQMITVFLQKMTDDRKIGEKITNSEYIEAFVVHPNSVTVQIRIDKGDYWVMSRETFESKNNYPDQTDVSYSDLLLNFEDMQNRIDNTKYILNNEF